LNPSRELARLFTDYKNYYNRNGAPMVERVSRDAGFDLHKTARLVRVPRQ
jgi:hypothetical protein